MPQPVPAIPQIPAGWSPLVADMTTWVTNPFTFLATPPVLRAQLQGAQALTGGTYNTLHFGTTAGDIIEDPYGGWSTTTTANQPAWSWLCPVGCPGWYELSMSGFTANQATSTGQTAMVVFLNGSLWQYASDDWAVNGGDSGTSGSQPVPLVPGDYIQALLFSTASVSTPTTAGQLPAVELTWISS